MLLEKKMQFQHTFTCIVAGPIKVGKAEWKKGLVKNADNMLSPPPKQVGLRLGLPGFQW